MWLLLLVFSSTSSPTWQFETIEEATLFWDMTDRSLCLDSQGNPHIAYGEDQLYYAYHDGYEWHHEIADHSPKVGWFASIAVDDSGHPHISYHDGSGSHLKYAYRTESGWHTEIADATDGPDRLDATGENGRGAQAVAHLPDRRAAGRVAVQDIVGTVVVEIADTDNAPEQLDAARINC